MRKKLSSMFMGKKEKRRKEDVVTELIRQWKSIETFATLQTVDMCL